MWINKSLDDSIDSRNESHTNLVFFWQSSKDEMSACAQVLWWPFTEEEITLRVHVDYVDSWDGVLEQDIS